MSAFLWLKGKEERTESLVASTCANKAIQCTQMTQHGSHFQKNVHLPEVCVRLCSERENAPAGFALGFQRQHLETHPPLLASLSADCPAARPLASAPPGSSSSLLTSSLWLFLTLLALAPFHGLGTHKPRISSSGVSCPSVIPALQCLRSLQFCDILIPLLRSWPCTSHPSPAPSTHLSVVSTGLALDRHFLSYDSRSPIARGSSPSLP